MPPEICPVCGESVPSGAQACPQCGADDETGWSEDARHNELDLPDETFDYDRFVKEEFGSDTPKPEGISWLWWLVAGLIVLLLAWVSLGGLVR